MNHRCGERRNGGMTLLLRRRGWHGWVVGQLRNVSVSGAFVQVPAGSLTLHSQVRLELKLPGASNARIVHCNGMVVRVVRDGVGLAFEEIAPGALAALWREPGYAGPARPAAAGGQSAPAP